MPSQLLYMILNYGSMALVVAAMVVGVVLTKGTVRTLIAAALAAQAVGFASTLTLPAMVYAGGDAAFLAYSVIQTLLNVAPVVLLVAAAVVGVRNIAVKEAAIAALVDRPAETWTQPETSPDPRLLAD
jgi:hypothetical protein